MRVLSLICFTAALIKPFRSGETVPIRPAGIGLTRVTTSFPVGRFPTANFRTKTGKLLLSVPLGTADPDLFRIEAADPDHNPELKNLGPTKVAYFVVEAQKGQEAVLAVAKYTGGSDCSYASAVIGAAEDKLQTWFRQKEIVNSQGGLFIGDLGGSRGFGLAAWTDLWEDGGHYSQHRYRIQLYRIDTQSGHSHLVLDKSTLRKHSPRDALTEFGLHYDNFLHRSSTLGC